MFETFNFGDFHTKPSGRQRNQEIKRHEDLGDKEAESHMQCATGNVDALAKLFVVVFGLYSS